jgi:peptidyl-prolyl cis-trans isomerase C
MSMKSIVNGCVWVVLPVAILAGGCRKTDEAPELSANAPSVQVAPAGAAGDDASRDFDQVVVSVNGESLTQGELSQMVGQFMSQQNVQGLPPEMMQNLVPRIEQRVIDGFIARNLLLQEARKQQVIVSPEEVEEALADLQNRLPPGVTMDAALADLQMSEDMLKDQLTKDLQARKLIEGALDDVEAPTDEEIEAFYIEQSEAFETPETVHARHILVKVDEEDDETAKAEKRAEAEGYREQLVGGADFETLAKEVSDCPSSESGGDLGAFQRGQMVPPFEEAAFSQQVGEVGPVVETPFGYHVVEVLEHNAGSKQELADVSEDIAMLLGNRKKQQAAEQYIEQLKTGADIQYGGQSQQD